MNEQLCLALNQAEYSFASDRWACSMPKGHGGEMHVAFLNHNPRYGVVAAWCKNLSPSVLSWVDSNPDSPADLQRKPEAYRGGKSVSVSTDEDGTRYHG